MDQSENKTLKDDREAEMPFLDHLEELRWRIIFSIIGIAAGTILSWIFIDYIIEDILLYPALKHSIKLQNIQPFGQLVLYFKVAIIIGIIISIPNIFYQVWKFISPALKENEKKYISSIVLFSSICFLAGIMFAYYIMLPFTLKFINVFGTDSVENNFSLDLYFDIILSIMLAAGVVFELPMLSFFLSKIGILKPEFMRKFRRHSIVFILVIAAFLTPGTDPVAQILLAIPLLILYEISIFVSKYSQKKN